MLEHEYQPRRSLAAFRHRRPEPEAEFTYSVREATERDLPDVREIYNHYVANSTVTFDEAPWSLAVVRKKYAKVRELGYPFLVAESGGGHVLGFAYVLPWKDKAAYRYTVENSIYLGPASTGKGLGKALMESLLESAREAGAREVIAVIADRGAEASIALHEKFGFVTTGTMGRVGYKFDRWLGVVMMQKSLAKKRKPSREKPASS